VRSIDKAESTQRRRKPRGGWELTLKVGVRSPFSTVNGSGTNVTAFTNSNPLN